MVAPAVAALALVGCPHDATLGSVTFARAGHEHVVSLGDCRNRVVGRARPAVATRVPGVVVRGSTLWTRRKGKLVRLTEPLPSGHGMRSRPEPVSRSPDKRYVVWFRATNSASLSADGLELEVTPLAGGVTHRLGLMLAYRDYLTWCGSTLVFTAGGDRIATHNKRLVAASAPSWRPHSLWPDAERAFGSVACAMDEASIVVLSQPASGTDYNLFRTRWELWRVRLDGTHTLLDRPPPGFADESPRWSRDQRSLLFVRERKGVGRLMLLRGGRIFGPIAELEVGNGYYGHRDWWATMEWSLGVRQP